MENQMGKHQRIFREDKRQQSYVATISLKTNTIQNIETMMAKESKEAMATEENKHMLALSYIIADLKTENMMLRQRVHQLMEEYDDVVRQLNGLGKRKDEDPARQTLGEMRDLCDRLELENKDLKKYVKAIDSFMIENRLYMPKGTSCADVRGHPAVASPSCLECDSCLRLLGGYGVVCRLALEGTKITK